MAQKRNLALYDGSKTYVMPSGKLATPGTVAEKWPAAAQGVPYVIETDASGTMLLSMDSLALMRAKYDIGAALPDAEAAEAVAQAMYEAELAAEGDPAESSPEERIAAALELANTINLPTVNDDDPDAE